MKNNDGCIKWAAVFAIVAVASLICFCLYAQTDECDMMACGNYGVCEGSMI